jgi:subtilisin family serine protease
MPVHAPRNKDAYWTRGVRVSACLLLICSIALNVALAAPAAPAHTSSTHMIIVALTDTPDPVPTAGSTPRGYGGLPNYTGGERAAANAAQLAREYRLHEVSAWTIDPLRLRCLLYEIPATMDRADLLVRLQHDRRVRLAQPLQNFDTYASPEHSDEATTTSPSAAYNDPYISLQHGFSAIDAGAAQHWASGAGVRVALIDTGVDAKHPDLAGRITAQRDFVTSSADAPDLDRHGTEVAGVIAAVANNRLGIVGVAPRVRVLSYRACWPTQANADAARCNTFTLAQALGAAIASGADIINLSLGGPRDPLLEQLAGYAVKHGSIVVGAVPPNGRMDGFPVDVSGVIAVTSVEDPRASGAAVLAAPGRDILTLEPGGHYDYASGSSLATAHVTGAIALLIELNRHLDARALVAALNGSRGSASAPIDVCAAMLALDRIRDNCRKRVMAQVEPGRAAR